MAPVPEAVRRCSRCGETTPLDEFPIKSRVTGLRRGCRLCCRAYGREHYWRDRDPYLNKARARRREERPRIRAAVGEYLRTHPCIDCGETDILLLDFDHRDRAAKLAPVSRLAHWASLGVVLSEIAKCDVRCGNCHRSRTATQRNWRKAPEFESKRRILPPPKREPRAPLLVDRSSSSCPSGPSESRRSAQTAAACFLSMSSHSVIDYGARDSTAADGATPSVAASITGRIAPTTFCGRPANRNASTRSRPRRSICICGSTPAWTAESRTSSYSSLITSRAPR